MIELFFFRFLPLRGYYRYGVSSPVLHSRSLLVICVMYGSGEVLIPNPDLSLPPPFPCADHPFFDVCRSMFVLSISSFMLLFKILHIREIRYVPFSGSFHLV